MHKKIYNLGSEEFFQDAISDYQMAIKEEKKFLADSLSNENHPFQKRQEEIYHHFFTRK